MLRLSFLHSFYSFCSFAVLGLVPYDGVPERKIVAVHPILCGIYTLLACAGIVFAIACLVFNFKFRNTRYSTETSVLLHTLVSIILWVPQFVHSSSPISALASRMCSGLEVLNKVWSLKITNIIFYNDHNTHQTAFTLVYEN